MDHHELIQLIQTVKRLRDPEKGCPWDLKQTHKSLIKYLFEESYEFKESCELQNWDHMEEELGDILLQVLLHATIGEQEKKFNLESVSKKLNEKLIRRHPHVFGNEDAKSSEEVLARWEEIKKEEGSQDTITSSDLYLSALASSYKIGKKANKQNFDWENAQQVLYKVEEEWQEVKEEIPPNQKVNVEKLQEEIGDLLFSVVQLARHFKLDPEETLHSANKKFAKRFNMALSFAHAEGQSFDKLSLHQKESLWAKAKKTESLE